MCKEVSFFWLEKLAHRPFKFLELKRISFLYTRSKQRLSLFGPDGKEKARGANRCIRSGRGPC